LSRRARTRPPQLRMMQHLRLYHQARPSRHSHHRVASSDRQPCHQHGAPTRCRPCRQGRRSGGPAYWRGAPTRCRPCRQGRRSGGPAYWRDGPTRCRRCRRVPQSVPRRLQGSPSYWRGVMTTCRQSRRGSRTVGPWCRATTRCWLFRRGLRRCPPRLLPGFGGRRPGGRGGGLARARCRRWIERPRKGCRRRGGSGRPGRTRRPVGCSWGWTAVVRTAVWPGGTGHRPRTGTRSRRQRTVRSPRRGIRHCRGVRTGVVRAGPVVGFPPQGWTGCRTATSARPPGSPSCVACTGCCRTRTLFGGSLHCLAPKTCLNHSSHRSPPGRSGDMARTDLPAVTGHESAGHCGRETTSPPHSVCSAQ
jgi:hypothetical protein